MKLLILFITFFILTSNIITTNAVNNELVFIDESKSIRELKENIEILDKNKEKLIEKSKDFSPDLVLK